MCGICGCADDEFEDEAPLHHEHEITQTLHQHTHHHDDVIRVERDLLAKNNDYAATNRDYFLKKKITAINLMSSPGSGKTTLLSRTLSELKDQINMSVIVGDQQTDHDAQQLKLSGAEALQINTGRVCHLDAHMVGHSVEHLSLKSNGILFIENVGNLVCPALFDLGETYKIVLLSVTEGDNKPLKYPDMFYRADLVLLTKMDLLPYVDFNINKCIEHTQQINPSVKTLPLSTTTGTGLKEWYQWLMDCD